jgi:hypothetical protein
MSDKREKNFKPENFDLEKSLLRNERRLGKTWTGHKYLATTSVANNLSQF